MKRFCSIILVCVLALALFAGCGGKNSRSVFGAAGYEYGVADYEYGPWGVTDYEYGPWGVTGYEYDLFDAGYEYGGFYATPEPDARATRPSGDMYYIPDVGWVKAPAQGG